MIYFGRDSLRDAKLRESSDAANERPGRLGRRIVNMD